MEKIKSIVSTLAELESAEAIEKLKEYALEIKDKILCQNNDARLESLDLLERFSFRVPNEALTIISIFADKRNEQKATHYKKPFPRYGWKHGRIMDKCLDILNQYNIRYGFFDESLKLLMQFCVYKENDKDYEEIRKKTKGILIDTAKYNLKIIAGKPDGYGMGYLFQEKFSKKAKKILSARNNIVFNIAIAIIEELLNTEMEGTYWDYKTVTFKGGPLMCTSKLKKIRDRVLKIVFEKIKGEAKLDRKATLIKTLASGVRLPARGVPSDDLDIMIMADVIRIMKFYEGMLLLDKNPVVLQEIEEQAAFLKRRYTKDIGNKHFRNKVVRKTGKLLNALRGDNIYKIYRIFVGDERSFWDKGDDWKRIEEERIHGIKKMVADISEKNLTQWIGIIKLIGTTYKYKQEYEFSNFRFFGRHIGKEKPAIAYKIIKMLSKQRFSMKNFYSDLILGIRVSSQRNFADLLIKDWIKGKDFELICEIPHTFWALEDKFMKSQDVNVFKKLLLLKLNEANRQELDYRILRVLPWIYKQNPQTVNDMLFCLLKRLPEKNISTFTDTILMANYRKQIILEKWPMKNFKIILQSLLRKVRLDYHEEEILAIYAKRKPLEVVDFFRKRIIVQKGKKIERFDAVPFRLWKLPEAFSKNVEYKKVLRRILLEWIGSNDWLLREEGSRFIYNLAPSIDVILKKELLGLIKTKKKKKIMIALRVLRSYEGASVIDDICKEALRNSKGDKDISQRIKEAFWNTGLVSGEYGMRDAYQKRMDRIKKWAEERNKYIKEFANEFAKSLKKEIVEETRRTEERIMRMKKGVNI